MHKRIKICPSLINAVDGRLYCVPDDWYLSTLMTAECWRQLLKLTPAVMSALCISIDQSTEVVCFDLLDFDVTYRVFVIYRSPSCNRLSVSCDATAHCLLTGKPK